MMVVSADVKQRNYICSVLSRESYPAISLPSLHGLEMCLQECASQVLILDIDSVPVQDNFIRKLKRENPGLCIFGLSDRPFHPELRETMGAHIYACLSKPIDPDELLFWISSIDKNTSGSRDSP